MITRNLLNCNSLEHLDCFLDTLSPRIRPFIGGRVFENAAYSYKLNTIVAHFKKITDESISRKKANKNEILKVKNKIEVLNNNANIILSKKNLFIRMLTDIRRLFGNILFNKSSILKSIGLKISFFPDASHAKTEPMDLKKEDQDKTTDVFSDTLKDNIFPDASHAKTEPMDLKKEDQNKIKKSISSQLIDLGFIEKELSSVDFEQSDLCEIKNEHDKILKEKQNENVDFPALIDIYKQATMEGLSLIANYLSRKHNLSDLYVCDTLKAFRLKLEEVKNSPKDQRVALIVRTFSSHVTSPNKQEEHAQHKVAVGIEKKAGTIKICIFDASPIKHNKSIDKSHLDLENGNVFSEQELVFAHLKASKVPNASYFCCTANRINDPQGGCSTAALRDVVAFLKDPKFFDNIEKFGKISNTAGSVEEPYYIDNLPPDFMKIAQSINGIQKYVEDNQNGSFFDCKQKLGFGKKNILETLDKHKKWVWVPAHHDMLKRKERNLLINDRLKKYQLIINYLLKNTTSDQLRSLIQEKLITVNEVQKLSKDAKTALDAFCFEPPLKKDSPLILNQKLPEDVKTILDEIFTKPLPPFASKDFVVELYNRGIQFIKLGDDNNIGFLRDLDYVIKFQRDSDLLIFQSNLQRILINDKIKKCIQEHNLKHITYIEKFVYLLPSDNNQDLNDANAIIVARKVNHEEVEFEKLTDVQYEELLTVLAAIKYADLRGPNLTWIEEAGEKKIALIDTEDIASKFVCNRLNYYLMPSFDHPWHRNKESRDIVEIAKKMQDDHPEASKKIIKFLLSYHRGVRRLLPKDDQIERKAIFAKVVASIEQEIQYILDLVNVPFKVKLS